MAFVQDALKLDQKAVDQIQPIVSDIYESLCKIPTLAPDWIGKVKVHKWLQILNGMKASEELTADQARQILFDLESAYTGKTRRCASIFKKRKRVYQQDNFLYCSVLPRPFFLFLHLSYFVSDTLRAYIRCFSIS